MAKRINISLLFIFLALGVAAQPDLTREAYSHYQDGELEPAKEKIDSALMLEEGQEDPYTWQIKGFIYKDLFNKRDRLGPERDQLREEAIEAYEKVLGMEVEKELKKSCRQGMEYLANTMFRDAQEILDTTRYEHSRELFERYVQVMKKLGRTDEELKEDRVAYYNQLGVVYMDLYEAREGHDQRLFQRVIDVFSKVIAMDPTNYLANYNSAIMYYNRGVQIANQVDPSKKEVTIEMVKKSQERAVQRFRKALPYMKEAHQQRPKRVETLEGLEGIYYSLNEDEKSEHYRELKEEAQKEKNED